VIYQRRKTVSLANVDENWPPFVHSPDSACRLLGFSRGKLANLIASGELKASRIGKRIVIRHSDVEALLERTAIKPGEELVMTAPATIDPEETEMLRDAAAALRRRADRQAKMAKDGTAIGEDGSQILTGAAAIAVRVSTALSKLAAEFELEFPPTTANAEHAHGNG
jgi:excisionase family DNA binding protein